MAKKKEFDTQEATAKFFTQSGADPTRLEEPKKETPVKEKARQGRPRLADEEKKRGKRYNLTLDRDLDRFLHEIVWIKRTNMTQYINDLIRADYDAYLQDCQEKGVNPFEGWENDNES